MEDSNAINKLAEAVDLIRMVEDLSAMERLSPSTMAGIRITLKNIREAVQSSHDALAQNRTNRPSYAAAPEKPAYSADLTSNATQIIEQEKNESPSLTDAGFRPPYQEAQKSVLIRRDLRASLEKLVDR